MMRSFFATLGAALLLAASACAQTHTEPLNTLPPSTPTSTWYTTMREFLRDEDADRFNEQFTNFAVSGCVAPASCPGAGCSGLSITPTSCTAYVAGHRVTETGAVTADASQTCWIALHRDLTGNVGAFMRVTGTHYVIQCGPSTEPTAPTNGLNIIKTITNGSTFTSVSNLAATSPVDGIGGIPDPTVYLEKDGTDSMSGDLNVGGNDIVNIGAGAVGTPSMYMGSDSDTGWYDGGTSTWCFAVSGTKIACLTGNGLTLNGTKIAGLAAGTAAAPGLYFSGDTDLGIYRAAADTFGIAAGGAYLITFSTSALTLAGQQIAGLGNGAVGNPAIQFASDPDTGIFRYGADALSIAAGGVEMVRVTSGTYAVFTNGISANSARVRSVASPVDTTDAVNKAYVDSARRQFVPADLMGCPSTTGCVSASVYPDSATGGAMNVKLFADAATTYGYWNVYPDGNWSGGALGVSVVWTANATSTSNTVSWEVGCNCVSAGDELAKATAYTTYSIADDYCSTSAGARCETDQANAGAVTCTGSCAADDIIVFQLSRLGAAGADDTATNADALGLLIEY